MWEGPYSWLEVVRKMKDGGNKRNGWSGRDYGLYQIYGKHILAGKNTLLYIGQACDQTFSSRFKQHYKDWIYGEPGLKICLGRLEDYCCDKDKSWKAWRCDVNLAEAILVYKYVPNYNSCLKQEYPKLPKGHVVSLIHGGVKGKLNKIDKAPMDYRYKQKVHGYEGRP